MIFFLLLMMLDVSNTASFESEGHCSFSTSLLFTNFSYVISTKIGFPGLRLFIWIFLDAVPNIIFHTHANNIFGFHRLSLNSWPMTILLHCRLQRSSYVYEPSFRRHLMLLRTPNTHQLRRLPTLLCAELHRSYSPAGN